MHNRMRMGTNLTMSPLGFGIKGEGDTFHFAWDAALIYDVMRNDKMFTIDFAIRPNADNLPTEIKD